MRGDLPADLRDPVISKVDLAGLPILTYTVASQRMDPEALSWFVDNEVSRAARPAFLDERMAAADSPAARHPRRGG